MLVCTYVYVIVMWCNYSLVVVKIYSIHSFEIYECIYTHNWVNNSDCK